MKLVNRRKWIVLTSLVASTAQGAWLAQCTQRVHIERRECGFVMVSITKVLFSACSSKSSMEVAPSPLLSAGLLQSLNLVGRKMTFQFFNMMQLISLYIYLYAEKLQKK